MEWYQNKEALKDAVEFLVHYSCCYGWNALVSDKTPCCDYRGLDNDIPDELREAIKEYLNDLSKEEYRKLNREISMSLGERFYVRKKVVIKLLSRLLANGSPYENKEMIMFSLKLQIKNRRDLLRALMKM